MTKSIRQLRREAALARVVDYLLEHGLGNAGLRTLAAAAGTSNRMLLYYFADKDELLLEAFGCVVDRLSARLAALLPEGRQPFDVLLSQMWLMLKEPEYAPYLRVWYEALGRVSQGEELYRAMAERVLDIWFKWFEPRLDAAPAVRADRIAAIVTAACGLVMVRYIGRAEEADAAAKVLSKIALESRQNSAPVAPGRRSRPKLAAAKSALRK
jgi:AcrR family transcriptional regulator